MGLFSWVKKTARSVGKTLTSGISHVGKSAISIGRGISGVIDKGIDIVKKGAAVVEKIPVVGQAAKALLDTPVGRQIKGAFDTVQDVNDALKEAVDIGQGVVDLADSINAKLSKGTPSKSEAKALINEAAKIGRKINKSKVSKKANKIPEVKRNIKKFNKLVKRLEKVAGKGEVQKLKQIVRA